jgi:hypothetical protein
VMEKGNELVAKTKKSVKIKSGQERRRDDLRKKIVVIGITDQSPGIYYSSSGVADKWKLIILQMEELQNGFERDIC